MLKLHTNLQLCVGDQKNLSPPGHHCGDIAERKKSLLNLFVQSQGCDELGHGRNLREIGMGKMIPCFFPNLIQSPEGFGMTNSSSQVRSKNKHDVDNVDNVDTSGSLNMLSYYVPE